MRAWNLDSLVAFPVERVDGSVHVIAERVHAHEPDPVWPEVGRAADRFRRLWQYGLVKRQAVHEQLAIEFEPGS